MKVSILIPAYNVANYMPECLESAINQTYTDLQIVVVNDGSTDDTLQYLNKYAEVDARIEVYSQQNKGVAATRNNLLSKVKGDAVLFVDADDWMELDMVESLVNMMGQNRADIAMCQLMRNNEIANNEITYATFDQQESIKRFLLHKELTGSLCNKLIKTSLLHNLRFREDVSYGEDALMLWRVLNRSNKLVVTSQQLYHYRVNDASLSHASFGKGKLSAYYVWNVIINNVDTMYPEFSALAHAQFAHQMNMLLFDAARCRFYDKVEIDKLRKVVKRNLNYLKDSHISNSKKLIFAHLVSISYRLAETTIKFLYL